MPGLFTPRNPPASPATRRLMAAASAARRWPPSSPDKLPSAVSPCYSTALRKSDPRAKGRELLFRAPRPVVRFTQFRDQSLYFLFGTSQSSCCGTIGGLLDKHCARNPLRPQRVFQRRAEELALERVGADVIVLQRSGIHHAAHDQPRGANGTPRVL